MKDFESESVLVIGGAGFIGSNIVDRLMEEGARVRVLDDLSNGIRTNISRWNGSSRFEFVQGDMRNREIVRNSLKDISTVFLQAAKVSIPFSIENPHLVMDVNVMGTSLVLDEARRSDIKKIVVASSSSVYGDTPVLPKVEDMLPNPISPYAASKLAQESISMSCARTYGMDIVALRYFNVYGPRQRGGHYAGVIQVFVTRALQNKPLPIDGDGQQTRDFTYIDDIVNANILAATSKNTKGKIYNVGGGAQISIACLADMIISETGSTSARVYRPARLGDVRDSLAGLQRITRELGYVPSWDIERGLASTIEWIQKNIG